MGAGVKAPGRYSVTRHAIDDGVSGYRSLDRFLEGTGAGASASEPPPQTSSKPVPARIPATSGKGIAGCAFAAPMAWGEVYVIQIQC
jgi:hypothetical protein